MAGVNNFKLSIKSNGKEIECKFTCENLMIQKLWTVTHINDFNVNDSKMFDATKCVEFY